MPGRKHRSGRGQKGTKAEDDLPQSPLSGLDPLEQVAKAREEQRNLLTPPGNNIAVNLDMEQNIREIRAILKMNAEILKRCMIFIKRASDGSDGSTTFERIRFEIVEVRKGIKNETLFLTRPIREKLVFDTSSLSTLPPELEIVFKHNMSGDKLSRFINFEKFVDNCFILHEDVLELFLPKLKEHLMTIQVCLGEIDSWVIQEPQVAISFIEDTFNVRIEMPGECECDSYGYDMYDDDECEECSTFQVLKRCNPKGAYATSFDITIANERTRLKKFLDFISI